MGILANPKHEAFAQHCAQGHAQIEAYRMAGYNKPSDAVASRLSRNVKVVKRIRELQAKVAEHFEITAEEIARKLDETYAFAKKCKVPSAMVQALHVKARLGGLMIDRASVQVTHSYASMSLEELQFELAALNAEARQLKPGVQH